MEFCDSVLVGFVLVVLGIAVFLFVVACKNAILLVMLVASSFVYNVMGIGTHKPKILSSEQLFCTTYSYRDIIPKAKATYDPDRDETLTIYLFKQGFDSKAFILLIPNPKDNFITDLEQLKPYARAEIYFPRSELRDLNLYIYPITVDLYDGVQFATDFPDPIEMLSANKINDFFALLKLMHKFNLVKTVT